MLRAPDGLEAHVFLGLRFPISMLGQVFCYPPSVASKWPPPELGGGAGQGARELSNNTTTDRDRERPNTAQPETTQPGIGTVGTGPT